MTERLNPMYFRNMSIDAWVTMLEDIYFPTQNF